MMKKISTTAMILLLSGMTIINVSHSFNTIYNTNNKITTISSSATCSIMDTKLQSKTKSKSTLAINNNYIQQQKQQQQQHQSMVLHMADDITSTTTTTGNNKGLPFWFDPNTKGGALVYMVLLFVIPVGIYNIMINFLQYDEIEAGITIGIGFTIISCLAWVSTYIFRVATKDMTYAKQLKDYENAVIAKRLEELDEDEIQALVEEVEKDNF